MSFLVFLVIFLQIFFQFVFVTVELSNLQRLLSVFFKTQNNFLLFFKAMVGSLCATCTVTGYPCYFSVSYDIYGQSMLDELLKKQSYFNFAGRNWPRRSMGNWPKNVVAIDHQKKKRDAKNDAITGKKRKGDPKDARVPVTRSRRIMSTERYLTQGGTDGAD